MEYKHERIQVNGEKVEGVFPQFESKDVERLPRKMWESSDAQQFSFCTQMLGQKLEHNPALESRFTPRQLEQIRNPERRHRLRLPCRAGSRLRSEAPPDGLLSEHRPR